ncbi:hypothetical protein [Clostridium sp. CF012]|uniref:hypothetical protein n=1 Tax=Clostridium sp. CF012 TaxID=2843319 RepID=UPI001C0D5F3B|nr:hypothetical protein [Clostridium sp. CF012]MBU3142930.1 hypothetical protein [Clostridium sp. CF012]
MGSNVQFITDLEDLLQIILITLNNENDYHILISGTFDHELFKKLLKTLVDKNKINKCKILMPYVSNSGILSRVYINKISKAGGEIRITSMFRKNLIVIGNQVFILSLSSRYLKDLGIKSNFECAIQTDDSNTINYINETFEKIWDKSLPIVSD